MTRRSLAVALAFAMSAAVFAPATAFFIPGFSLPDALRPSPSPTPAKPPPRAAPTIRTACGGAAGRDDVDALVCSPHKILGKEALGAVRDAAKVVATAELADDASCKSLLEDGGLGNGTRSEETTDSAGSLKKKAHDKKWPRVRAGWAVRVAVVKRATKWEARVFARDVLKAWKASGECACGDGVVLVVAVRSRVAVVEAGNTVAARVGEARLTKVVGSMRDTMDAWENHTVQRALVHALGVLHESQFDVGPPEPRTWVQSLGDGARKVLRFPLLLLDTLMRALVIAWEYFPLVYLVFLITGALLQCLEPLLPERFIFWRQAGQPRRLFFDGSYGVPAPSRLGAFVDGLRHVATERAAAGDGAVFPATTCPICLSQFGCRSPGASNDELLLPGADEATPLLRSEELRALSCGHVLHRDCIIQWLTSVCNGHGTTRCPICRAYEPLNLV